MLQVLFKGSSEACLLDPKIIFKKSILNNATRIIVAHNHPSGDLTPSEEDVEMAKKLNQAGDLMNVDVLDNIIFNKTEYYSLLGEGDI